jgi:hypothetical protein
MLTTIRQAWGWTGLEPVAVTAINAFGNVIVRAADGTFWRICPEDLSCVVVARDAAEYETLWASDGFQLDWQVTRLVGVAKAALGSVDQGRCYCLKIPAVFGGPYDGANFGTIGHCELIAFSGDVAQQVKDVPDGEAVRFDWTAKRKATRPGGAGV